MTEERRKAFLFGLDIPNHDWHGRPIGVGGPRKGMPVGVRPKDNALHSGPCWASTLSKEISR
jgi:hypothetical protein